ncbi:hypothetical protein I309_04092 [Cryptococcus deuterogattii LA55]|nr:hypothetical protein I309_04092 [Cryptococcus deuterogattii LA55]KIR95830.1 hypothetical protein I304_00586 [Cryptococcus deuterogattii CBS 10090]
MPPIVSTDRWQPELLGEWFVRLSPVDSSPDILVKDFSVTRLAASDDIPKKDGKLVKPVGLVHGGVILGRKSSQVKERVGLGGIASPILSRSHAHLTISPSGQVYITDLRSLHGTSIISAKEPSCSVVLKPFSPVQLCDQDTIVLGKRVNASNKSYAPVKFTVSFRYPELGKGSRDGERKYLGELSQEDLADKFLFANKKFLAAKAIKSTDTWKKAMTTSLECSVIPGAAVSGKSVKEPHKYGIPEWMRYSSEEPQLENIPMVADSGDGDDGIISISSKSRTPRIRSEIQKSDHQSVLSLSSDEEDEWPRGFSNEIANEGHDGEVDDNSFTDYDDLGSPEVFGVHEADHSADAKNMHGQSRDGENHAIQSQDDQSEHDYWSPYRSSPVAWHFSPDLSDYDNESDEQQNNSDAAALFSASVQDKADYLDNGNIGEAGYSGDKVNIDETLPQEPPVPQTQADKLASLDEDEQRESFYRAIAASFVEADGQGKALQFDSEALQLSSDNVTRLDSMNISSEQAPASDFSLYGSEQAALRNEKAALTKKKAELFYSYENENEDEDEDHNDYDDDEASRGDDMSIIYSSEEKEDDLEDRSNEDEAAMENSNCLIREKRPRQEVASNKYTDDKLLTGKIIMHVDTTIAQEVTTPSSSSEADSLDLPSSEGKKVDLHRDIEEEVAVFLEQSQQMLASHAAVMNELNRQETLETCRVQPTSSSSSSSSSESPVTPVIGRKRSLPVQFTEHEEPTIVQEASAALHASVEVSNPAGPPIKRRNVASTVGLVVLGAALGSIGTIAGLMQLAE